MINGCKPKSPAKLAQISSGDTETRLRSLQLAYGTCNSLIDPIDNVYRSDPLLWAGCPICQRTVATFREVAFNKGEGVD